MSIESVMPSSPGDSTGKESTCNAGDLGSIPGLGRSPGEGNDYPLQYSGLEISMDCILHGVAKSQTFPFLGIYPDKTIIQKDTGTTIFITAPFSIAKNGHNLIVH